MTDSKALQILLVEDNLTDVLLLEEALIGGAFPSSSHTLTHVQRLDDALRHLQDKGFDVALLDLGLPDSQGLETFARLQREHPAIPILILSGMDDDDLAVRAVKDGAQDFVVKNNLKDHRMDRTIRYAIERKRAEQRLLTSETSYRRLFETAQDGIFILDAETGQITDANPFLTNLLGYAIEEFVGKRLWEIAPFRDRAANKAAFRTLQEKGFIRYENLPLAAKSGAFVDVEFVSNVYDIGAKRVVQCNIRDITDRKRAEAQLRASEANLAKSQEMAHLGSWELDLSNLDDINTNPLLWSDEIFRILGYAHGEFEPSNDAFFRAVHPGDRETLSRMMGEAIGGGRPYSVDHRILLPDGQERVVHAQGEIVYDAETGKPLKMIGLGQDITEQRQAEAQLRFQKTLLEAQSEASPDGILALGQDGKILSHNQRYVQMWSIPPGVVAARDNAQFRQVVLDQVVNPEQVLSKAQHLYDHKDKRSHDEIFLRDGRVFDRYSSPIVSGEGAYHGRVWYFRDITERKRAEEALRESLEMLQAVKEGTTDAILVKDREGRYLMINAAGARFLGVTPDEALGRKDSDFFNPEMARQIHESEQGVLESGRESVSEETGTAAGITRTYLAIKAPYRSANGEIIGIIGISRDITEQKRIHAQMVRSERLAAMGALVAGVAHEINNPLAAISGQSQLLQMHPDPQVQDDGRAIKKMTDRATRIVRSLLTFARQASVSDRVSRPLRSLIEETLEIVRYNLRAGDVEVICNTEGPELFPLMNPGQIEQVLLNLINNGIHALQKRADNRVLAVTMLKTAQGGREWATITVSDNGPGIPQEVIDRIFDPFFTTKPQGEGTGLGLSICHGIVEEHEGRLEVISADGIGATFTLTLPLPPAAPDGENARR